MAKVIPLTKNYEKYLNVPANLRWAIPIHEAISSPLAKQQAKFLETLADQKLKQEDREELKKFISLVPRLPASSNTVCPLSSVDRSTYQSIEQPAKLSLLGFSQ